MEKEELIKRMIKHREKFSVLFDDIVVDVNKYVNEKGNFNPSYTDIEKFTDDLCLSGAWINDRLIGKSGVVHSKEYRGSLTKKIRKALGYTY